MSRASCLVDGQCKLTGIYASVPRFIHVSVGVSVCWR